MKLFTLSFLLSLSLISFSQNPWDGLSNEELSGNTVMPDGKGYLFNYGNNFPESDLDPTVMNCINDIGNIHNSLDKDGMTLSFDSLEYADDDPFGAGSLHILFDGSMRETNIQSDTVYNSINTKFSTGNCKNVDEQGLRLSEASILKIRSLIKVDKDCFINIYVGGKNNSDIFRVQAGNYFPTKIRANRWTIVEFPISTNSKFTDHFYSGIRYELTITDRKIEDEDIDIPVNMWIDWTEVGSAYGVKSTPDQAQKAEYIHLIGSSELLANNTVHKNRTGYEYNFRPYQAPYSGTLSCTNDINIQNIFSPVGISVDHIGNNSRISAHLPYKNGALKYSFDGTQKPQGYFSMRFSENSCSNMVSNPLNLSDTEHRKIKAFVKSKTDSYIRIFGAVLKGSDDGSGEFITLKYGNEVFDNPTFLQANEWTVVEFDIASEGDIIGYLPDYTKFIGLTFSLMNTDSEKTATAFTTDLLIDWIKIGEELEKYTPTIVNSNLSGNYSAQDGSGYIFDFNTPDTTDQAIKEINCIPVDSISNHIYNTTNIADLKVTITKQGQEASSGALNLNFSNLSTTSDWVINKFTQNDCQNMDVFGLDLTTVANQALSGTVKASQNATLKIALVQRDGSTYTIIEDANAMESVDLVSGVWTDVNLDLNDILNGNIVDLTTIVGVAYQITPATGNKKSGGTITLSIDQLKIGAATYKDISTTTAINTVSNKEITFTAFPNPANDILNIRSNSENCSYELVNLLGQSVLKFSEDSKNISDLAAGIYFLNCYQHDELKETLKIKIQ